jgi:hypothetical protein
MTQRFFDGGVTSKRSVERARRFVRATLAPFVREAAAHPFEVAVGSSGTIESLLGIARAAEGSVKQSVNGAVLTRAALGEVIERLIAAETPEARAEIKGVDKGRADIIVGGAVILEQVMDSLDIESLVVSEYALREGVLFDLNNRLHGASLDHLSDLRRRSIEHLMEVCDEDPDHSLQVAELALELFDGLEGRHGLGHDERELLEAAALLANVGLFICPLPSPPAQLLRDPELRAVERVHRPRDRDHRPGRPLSPARRAVAEARSVRCARRARPTSGCGGSPRSFGSPSASTAVTPELVSRPWGWTMRVVGADDAASVMITVVPNGGADVSLEVYAARERVGLLARMARAVPIEIEASSN